MKEIKTVTINGIERTAVNRLARVVTMPAKEIDLYEQKIHPKERVFDAPPKTKAVPRYLEDLTGTKRGKMTIVGYIGYSFGPNRKNQKKHPPHKWLAKCICGKYEIRDGYLWRKRMKNNTPDLGCAYCNQFERKQREAKIDSLN